ncbi:hypothetical protein MHA_2432 [Mannheimia haemolytica PHL213]|nr:hypothetical protein MHA_2432 [Mannheimia haemolytica PHL213]
MLVLQHFCCVFFVAEKKTATRAVYSRNIILSFELL